MSGLVVTRHAIDQAVLRYGLEGTRTEIGVEIGRDVREALEAGRVGKEAPSGFRHGAKVRNEAVVAWTEDLSRAYVITKGNPGRQSRGNLDPEMAQRDVIVTALPKKYPKPIFEEQR